MDENAIQLPEALRAQLAELGVDDDVQLFIQQKALKKKDREAKAAKVLAKRALASKENSDLCT